MRLWLGILAISLAWGIPYLFIAIALESLPPIWIAFSRLAIACLVMTPFLKGRPPFNRAVITVAVIEMALPLSLIAYGEQGVSSSLTGVLTATTPIWIAVLIPFFGYEKLTIRVMSGLGLGMAGVALVSGLDFKGELWAVGLIALAAFCYAAGTIPLAKQEDHLGTIWGAYLLASLLLLPILPFLPAPDFNLEALGSVMVLGVISSAAAVTLWTLLAKRYDPNRASLGTFIAPLWAISLGLLLNNEPFSWGMLIGFIVILMGVMMVGKAPEAPVE